MYFFTATSIALGGTFLLLKLNDKDGKEETELIHDTRKSQTKIEWAFYLIGTASVLSAIAGVTTILINLRKKDTKKDCVNLNIDSNHTYKSSIV